MAWGMMSFLPKPTNSCIKSSATGKTVIALHPEQGATFRALCAFALAAKRRLILKGHRKVKGYRVAQAILFCVGKGNAPALPAADPRAG